MNTLADFLSSPDDCQDTSDASNTLQNSNFERIIARAKPGQWIDLSHQQLSNQHMEAVVQRAIIDKQCSVLDLGSNNITSHGALILGNAVRHCASMQRLYLGDNQISDDGVEQLALSVKNSTLVVLGLAQNRISDAGTQHLGEMLKGNRHLIVLGLEDNQIGDQGVVLLANALKYNNKLQRLLLARNRMINGSSIDALVDMLQYNNSLKKLDLRACNLPNSARTRLEALVRKKAVLSYCFRPTCLVKD